MRIKPFINRRLVTLSVKVFEWWKRRRGSPRPPLLSLLQTRRCPTNDAGDDIIPSQLRLTQNRVFFGNHIAAWFRPFKSFNDPAGVLQPCLLQESTAPRLGLYSASCVNKLVPRKSPAATVMRACLVWRPAD